MNRGHNTDNFFEASIRVIKDIVLGRTKAYNCCAIVDFVAHVWQGHIKKRLLHYACDRESRPRLQFSRLCKKMPAGGSEKSKELAYEVNSLVGWCSCTVGKCGAFCKHQALIYTRSQKGFPNKPAITYIERYKLALLSLGHEKCPPVRFFLDFDESINVEEECFLSSQRDTVVGTYEVMEDNVLVPVQEDVAMDDGDESTDNPHQTESEVDLSGWLHFNTVSS
ncbi:Valine--tRNA ligase [Frankliniella fusca]|uniref:Valine--tRNA ligase n=1 Tax=Frankliniella fusca TaxID=407009 RepID=A0AAE1HB28_9NEOP|nr:Valine--tRNA ligase [Frankliniella fusca]